MLNCLIFYLKTDEENYYYNHKLVTLLMDHFKEIEVENVSQIDI